MSGKSGMGQKDFLKLSGLIILSLVGMGKVVSLLTPLLTKPDDKKLAIAESQKQTTRGYGSGGYSN